MKIHLDLTSGIAGNMFLGACVDMGLSLDALQEALSSLKLSGWSFKCEPATSYGIAGTHLDVDIPHEHHHRQLRRIHEIIDGSDLPAPVKDRAKAIFQTLAEAEATVHGTTPEQIHFHEVGAVDAIVDICGAAWAVWKLGITEVTATPLVTGSGWVDCAHGRMPIPAPATAEMIKRHKIPIAADEIRGEMATPTGTAILINLVTRFGPHGLSRIDRTGYGLGTKVLEKRANALRILAQDSDEDAPGAPRREWVGVCSTHVDDMNPEWYGLLWERLFAAGALDVALIPIQMKKGRPASRIEVVTPPGREAEFARMLLEETTAIGVRFSAMERLVLPRESKTVVTPWGSVRAKVAGGVWRVEYDDLARVAREQEWSLPMAQQKIMRTLAQAVGGS